MRHLSYLLGLIKDLKKSHLLFFVWLLKNRLFFQRGGFFIETQSFGLHFTCSGN